MSTEEAKTINFDNFDGVIDTTDVDIVKESISKDGESFTKELEEGFKNITHDKKTEILRSVLLVEIEEDKKAAIDELLSSLFGYKVTQEQLKTQHDNIHTKLIALFDDKDWDFDGINTEEKNARTRFATVLSSKIIFAITEQGIKLKDDFSFTNKNFEEILKTIDSNIFDTGRNISFGTRKDDEEKQKEVENKILSTDNKTIADILSKKYIEDNKIGSFTTGYTTTSHKTTYYEEQGVNTEKINKYEKKEKKQASPETSDEETTQLLEDLKKMKGRVQIRNEITSNSFDANKYNKAAIDALISQASDTIKNDLRGKTDADIPDLLPETGAMIMLAALANKIDGESHYFDAAQAKILEGKKVKTQEEEPQDSKTETPTTQNQNSEKQATEVEVVLENKDIPVSEKLKEILPDGSNFSVVKNGEDHYLRLTFTDKGKQYEIDINKVIIENGKIVNLDKNSYNNGFYQGTDKFIHHILNKQTDKDGMKNMLISIAELNNEFDQESTLAIQEFQKHFDQEIKDVILYNNLLLPEGYKKISQVLVTVGDKKHITISNGTNTFDLEFNKEGEIVTEEVTLIGIKHQVIATAILSQNTISITPVVATTIAGNANNQSTEKSA